METPVVETTPTITPDAPITAPTEIESSLADHEAQFGRGAKKLDTPTPAKPQPTSDATETDAERQAREDGERDERGRFQKTRAEKQKATKEDAPRIAELTRRLRETERERDELRQRTSPTPPVAAPAAQPFAAKEPKLEDFAMADDPHTAWLDARQDWRWEKKIHEARQEQLAKQVADAQREGLTQAEQIKAKVDADIAEFEQTHPDFMAKLEAVDDIKFPDILGHVIATSDNPAQLMYDFATHPDDLVDAIGFAGSLAWSDSSVALLRRRLNRYTRATDATPQESTGAPKPAPSVIVAPKPPTPVRTGPLKTGDDPPGDNDMSLANHEKFFGRKRR